MKHSFKIGDRVAVYRDIGRTTGKVYAACIIDDHMSVYIDGTNTTVHIHHKQLRHLKPKPPLRRIWCNYSSLRGPLGPFEDVGQAISCRMDCGGWTVEFVEVRKPKEKK